MAENDAKKAKNKCQSDPSLFEACCLLHLEDNRVSGCSPGRPLGVTVSLLYPGCVAPWSGIEWNLCVEATASLTFLFVSRVFHICASEAVSISVACKSSRLPLKAGS